MKQKNLRLTLKTAKKLFKQEFGLPTAMLYPERADNGVYIYSAVMGRFEISVSNDWFEHNGLFKIGISSHTGECIDLYYNPETLEEDFGAADKNRDEIRKEQCYMCSHYVAAHDQQ